MIFISYNHKDSEIVDPIVQKLSVVFGQDKIFYDKWSIQPGDGIIDKMNKGLKEASFLFLFLSKNSLESNLVKVEWQNGMIKSVKGKLKLVPVKLDDCLVPEVLLQNIYIDIFGKGPEFGTRQIIDVINGKNTYQPGPQTYENIRGYIKKDNQDLLIEFRAETYSEPISRYLILTDNDQEDFNVRCIGDNMFNQGFQKDFLLSNGLKSNALMVGVSRATSPGFPLIVKIIAKNNKEIKLKALMRAVSHDQFRGIPFIL